MAGRTTRLALGSMVVYAVDDPCGGREVSMLDSISAVDDPRARARRGQGPVRRASACPWARAGSLRRNMRRCCWRGSRRATASSTAEFVSQPRADIRPHPSRASGGALCRRRLAGIDEDHGELGVASSSFRRSRGKRCQELTKSPRALPPDQRRRAASPDLGGLDFCDSRCGSRPRAGEDGFGGYFRSVLDHYQSAPST